VESNDIYVADVTLALEVDFIKAVSSFESIIYAEGLKKIVEIV